MSTVNRTVGKVAARLATFTRNDWLHETKGLKRYQKSPGALTRLFRSTVGAVWYKAFIGPLERWHHACLTRFLREHGLLYDDLMTEREPIVERALELLPEDLKIARFRRIARGMHISILRMYPPLEEQNYDPYIPYLAPYIEEAKFQIQEEEELLGYHPIDRRFCCGGTTGFGEFEPGMHFLTCIPNFYGGATGHLKKKH